MHGWLLIAACASGMGVSPSHAAKPPGLGRECRQDQGVSANAFGIQSSKWLVSRHGCVLRLNGGADVGTAPWDGEQDMGLRDENGISLERFANIWGGPVLWREGQPDPRDDPATGWELGSKRHGVCVPWCDGTDSTLMRAAEEEEERAKAADVDGEDDDEEEAPLRPEPSARFPLVGNYGALFEAFEKSVSEFPESVESSFAILEANATEALHSRIVYASPLFVNATGAPSLEAVLGKPWGAFYGHVDAEKREHFAKVVSSVGEACESRFVMQNDWWRDASARDACNAPDTSTNSGTTWSSRDGAEAERTCAMESELQELKRRLAAAEHLLGLQSSNSSHTAVMYAQAVVYTGGYNDAPCFVGVGVCDVTGWPVGAEGTTTYLESDILIDGVERTGVTGVTATHFSALEHLQTVVGIVKEHMSAAIIQTFPRYQHCSTEWNKRRQFDEAYERCKGPNRLHELWARVASREDDIWNEDVDALCDEVGEWYRDFHAETLRGVARLEQKYKKEAQLAAEGLADTCAPPPDHPVSACTPLDSPHLRHCVGEQGPPAAHTLAEITSPQASSRAAASGCAEGEEARGLRAHGAADAAGASMSEVCGKGSLEGCEKYYTGGGVEGDETAEEKRLENAKRLFTDLLEEHAAKGAEERDAGYAGYAGWSRETDGPRFGVDDRDGEDDDEDEDADDGGFETNMGLRGGFSGAGGGGVGGRWAWGRHLRGARSGVVADDVRGGIGGERQTWQSVQRGKGGAAHGGGCMRAGGWALTRAARANAPGQCLWANGQCLWANGQCLWANGQCLWANGLAHRHRRRHWQRGGAMRCLLMRAREGAGDSDGSEVFEEGGEGSGLQIPQDGENDGLEALRKQIVDMYIQRFPAYDKDKDSDLLRVRADEAVLA
jgi:hypothetical protein